MPKFSTQEKIRLQLGKLRTSKLPLSDIIPLMQEAADRLDLLEAKIRVLESGGPSLNQLCALFKPIPNKPNEF